jgi:hypothetical protein
MPHGLRFTADGTELAVADCFNRRVGVFRVADGSFVRHVATGLSGPQDVEECAGGWLVACSTSHSIESASGASGAGGGGDIGGFGLGTELEGSADGEFTNPSALALVPGQGLVVRELGNGGRFQFFATHDAVAMGSMSSNRVAWIAAVVRSGRRRRLLAGRR